MGKKRRKTKEERIKEKREADLKYRMNRVKPFKWIRYYMSVLFVLDIFWFLLFYTTGNIAEKKASLLPVVLALFGFVVLIREMKYITGESDSLYLTYIYHITHLIINCFVSVSIIVGFLRKIFLPFIDEYRPLIIIMFILSLVCVVISILSVRKLKHLNEEN